MYPHKEVRNNGWLKRQPAYNFLLLFLMTIGTQAFFPFMRVHLFLFSFFTAWHLLSVYLLMSSFTRDRINLLGLNVGTYRSGR